MLEAILNWNNLYIFMSGLAAGWIAHLKGDDRLLWFFTGFMGWLAPIISMILAGRGKYAKKKDK
jgi:hypothetical protein